MEIFISFISLEHLFQIFLKTFLLRLIFDLFVFNKKQIPFSDRTHQFSVAWAMFLLFLMF